MIDREVMSYVSDVFFRDVAIMRVRQPELV